jgi:hypothetical protein
MAFAHSQSQVARLEHKQDKKKENPYKNSLDMEGNAEQLAMMILSDAELFDAKQLNEYKSLLSQSGINQYRVQMAWGIVSLEENRMKKYIPLLIQLKMTFPGVDADSLAKNMVFLIKAGLNLDENNINLLLSLPPRVSIVVGMIQLKEIGRDNQSNFEKLILLLREREGDHAVMLLKVYKMFNEPNFHALFRYRSFCPEILLYTHDQLSFNAVIRAINPKRIVFLADKNSSRMKFFKQHLPTLSLEAFSNFSPFLSGTRAIGGSKKAA